eukprot:SAG11_NODE_18398_length_492_cov_0.908397_1_plen_110_part_10
MAAADVAGELPLARVLASVTTGLESVAGDEVRDKLGAGVADAERYTGSLRLTVPRARLGRLRALRCVGQLTVLVREDVAFFSGSAGGVADDLARLREVGAAVDWPAAAAL